MEADDAATLVAITGCTAEEASGFLEMAGGNIETAASLFFETVGDALPAASAVGTPAGHGHGAADEAQEEEGEEEEEEGDDDDNEDDDDLQEDEVEDNDDDDGDDDEGSPTLPPPKRLRLVQPTEPAKLAAAGKSHVALFDERMLRKTYLDLLNLMPSKLSHTSFMLWANEHLNEAEAMGLVHCSRAGWWSHRFPVAEVDHVWRVVVNAHLHTKSLGKVRDRR